MNVSSPAQEYLDRGEQLFNSGSYFDAARFYRRAWELDPTLLRAVVYMGDCCSHMGRHFVALEFYWEALLCDRKDSLSWMMLGDTYLRLGRLELAFRFFSQALHLNPTDSNLIRTVESLPAAGASMRRFFTEQLVPEDQWTSPLDTQRTSALQADLRNAVESSWIKVCFFYREYLNPKRFQKLENALNIFSNDSRFAEMRAARPDVFQAVAQQTQKLLDGMRRVIAPLEKYAGPPFMYRFDGVDGAQPLSPSLAIEKIVEREKLIQGSPEKTDDVELQLQGIQALKTLLRDLPQNAPANLLKERFAFALSDALVERNFESAQALAFGEMELTMCFASPGLAESEMLPSGDGISDGAHEMDQDQFVRARKFIENATTPEEAVAEVKARGWHVETLLNSLCLFGGPQMYLLYAVDYSKSYDLAKKMVTLSDLLPEHLRRFPLRAFYRLQGLVSLEEAAAKLGLHEETIGAGSRIVGTIEEMGPDWRIDLPQYPATMMRLGEAQLPEKVLERACTLMAGAYRSLGDTVRAASTSAKITQIASEMLLWRGRIASSDCLALMEELKDTDGLDGALKYAYMALAFDERKYREAGVQFHANRVLGEMIGELGLPRLEMIHWLRALAAAVVMGIPFNVLFCLHSMGIVLERQRDLSGAEYFYRKALKRIEAQSVLQKSMITTKPAIGSLFRLAILIKNHAPEEARSLMERAVAAIETQREAINADLSAAGFGQAGSEIYAELVDLNLGMFKDNSRAFATLERSKIRALLDQFAKRTASEQRAHPPAGFADVCSALVAS